MKMDSTHFLRQLDIADPAKFKNKPVTVIGAGGIGAATVVALAKTGFENITVYDFDTIGEHNLPNQLLPVREGIRTHCPIRKPPPCFTWSTTWQISPSHPFTNTTSTNRWARLSSRLWTHWTHTGRSGLRFRGAKTPSSAWTGVWSSPRWICTPLIRWMKRM